MKLNFPKTISEYSLPKGYKVIDKLMYSPMSREFVLYCKTKKAERAMVYFNGIDEMPIQIHTFWCPTKTDKK